MKERVDKEIIELQAACFEYPPDLKKIEQLLSKIELSRLYSAFGDVSDDDYISHNCDFVGNTILEYFWDINRDWMDRHKYNEKKITLKKEKYFIEILKLFLSHGYRMDALEGRVGASCLHALIWSDFNDYLMETANLLIDASADPRIMDEEGNTVLDTIEFHLSGTDWYYDDEYLDNRRALCEYYRLCERIS